MLVFQKIRYKNFLSSGNSFTEVDFQGARTTLVIGKNGGGKSTLIDALHFALYGKPFRNINKPQLLNSINRKDMVVELEFSSGRYQYLIRRGIKPTVFEVYQDGTLINQNAESKEYQDVLEQNVIKMTSRTFSQIVVLGSRSYTPFMQLPGGQRREIIEGLLDIQMFTVMNTLLKEQVSENKSKLQDSQYQVKNLNSQIEMLQRHLAAMKRNKKELIDQKKETLTTLSLKRTELQHKVSILEKAAEDTLQKMVDADAVDAREKALRSASTKIETRLERLIKEIEFYTENDSCPTCKQGIAHDHKHSVIDKDQKKVDELKDGASELVKKLDAVHERQREIRQLTHKLLSIQRDESSLKVEINLTGQNIGSIEKEIASIGENNEAIEPVENELHEKKNDLQVRSESVTSLSEHRQVLDVAAILLKDTGIKTKIIRQYIPVINKLINKYLASMDFFVNFELNDSFEEIIKSRHRDEFTYASFSEGEKARLDIAILFTWRAIAKLRNSASTNLLILDEVFDGSLDAIGNEELFSIIGELATDSSVIVISHRSESMADRFERTLKFQKNGNFSEMITQ